MLMTKIAKTKLCGVVCATTKESTFICFCYCHCWTVRCFVVAVIRPSQRSVCVLCVALDLYPHNRSGTYREPGRVQVHGYILFSLRNTYYYIWNCYYGHGISHSISERYECEYKCELMVFRCYSMLVWFLLTTKLSLRVYEWNLDCSNTVVF